MSKPQITISESQRNQAVEVLGRLYNYIGKSAHYKADAEPREKISFRGKYNWPKDYIEEVKGSSS